MSAFRPAILLPALMIAACTKVVQIDEAKIDYAGTSAGTIVLSAPLRYLSDLKNASALYLAAFPCGQQAGDNTAAYAVDRRLIQRSLNRAMISASFGAHDPQPPRNTDGELCVQLKAEGMSLRHYRSNIVRVSELDRAKPT